VHCVVTAGPTFEKLDNVRRLTNFSTGRLGTELANFLTTCGHRVTLLIGEQAIWPGAREAERVQNFTTTSDLRSRLEVLGKERVDAVFHAAAVSDFAFGKIWRRSEGGELTEDKSGKISTREGILLAELVPTTKIISELRDWFPKATLIGWKFEVEGGREAVLGLAQRQIVECRTNACVANGVAYGDGFGLVRAGNVITHCVDTAALYEALNEVARAQNSRPCENHE
jgi:phosphopantothenoylcysteine synthetase/decarboxylase